MIMSYALAFPVGINVVVAKGSTACSNCARADRVGLVSLFSFVGCMLPLTLSDSFVEITGNEQIFARESNLQYSKRIVPRCTPKTIPYQLTPIVPNASEPCTVVMQPLLMYMGICAIVRRQVQQLLGEDPPASTQLRRRSYLGVKRNSVPTVSFARPKLG